MPLGKGSVDWRVPDYMLQKLKSTRQMVKMNIISQQAMQHRCLFVASKHSDDGFAESFYDEHREPGDEPAT